MNDEERIASELDFDVVVVGGALVGSSLAAALADSGLRIALVDAAGALPTTDQDVDYDVRVFAISPGSERFLTAIGAWPQDSARVAPVRGMRVFGDAAPGRIHFDAREAGAAHLACIVENRVLMRALRTRLGQLENLITFAGGVGVEAQFGAQHAWLRLNDGTVLRARLLVAADGARSWLRSCSDIQVKERAYGQSAVVANFACMRPHRDLAYQWFLAEGVLALLPLPGHRCSMVWSAAGDVAAELIELAPDELARRVEQASGEVLGSLTVITPATAFPLQLMQAERLVRPRLALVGDAAHNLHPLAGQGVNLGFQDARELAQVLRERGSCADVGEYRLLRRYERARREDILAMILATDGLQRLFDHPSPPLKWIRNRGLTLVDRAGPLKRLLMRQAFG